MKSHIIILLTVCMLLFVSMTQAQNRRRPSYSSPAKELAIEALPRHVIDTIATDDPETKVIIFSNNTWEFFRPKFDNKFRDHEVYKYNWDTTSIFSYRNVELKDIPEIVELKLFDSLPQFCSPMVGRVSSKYGPRRRRNHNGTDLPLRTGEPLFATFDGKIRYAKYNTGGYGYLVIVRHPNGLETWYAHLSKLNVRVNDYVKAGQVIGFGGNTGRSRGSHLHFETRYQDQSFDSEFLFDFETGQIRYQTFALERSFFNIHSRASEILEEDDFDIDLPGNLLAEASDTTIQVVQKPKPKPVSTEGAQYHTIVSGNTLGHIAMKYGVSIDQLCRLNNITRTTTLALGRKLRVR